MKAKKRGRCKCLAISRWRCWDFCHCKETTNLTIYWIAQTFEIDGEQWRIFANWTYIAITNDNGTDIYFTTSVGYSGLPEGAEYALTIINNTQYNTLKALADRLSEASDADGVNAKTQITNEEQHLIQSNIDRAKGTTVKLTKDWDEVIGIYDYHLSKKLWEVSVADSKYYIDGKEIYIDDSEDWEVTKDYFARVFVDWVENVPVDFKISAIIRELVKKEVVNNISYVDENNYRVTNSEWIWLYDIQIESDWVTIQVVENDEEVVGSFSLAFEDSEDLLDYLPFVIISEEFNNIVMERIENDDFIHNA